MSSVVVSVFRRFLFLATVPLALSACGNDSSSTGSNASEHLAITISDAGCDPAEASVRAGKIAFDVTNEGSSKVTEFYIKQNDKTIGEVENVVPGSPKTLTATLKQGTYDMQCPNGTTSERGVLTVTQGGESGSSTTCAGPGIGGYGEDSGDHGGASSGDESGSSGAGSGADGSGGGTNTGGCGTANTSTNQTNGRAPSGDNSGGGDNNSGVTPGGGGTPNVTIDQ